MNDSILEVGGAGSEIEVTGTSSTINVGLLGIGALTVDGGGLVTADTINVGTRGTLDGDGGTIAGDVIAAGLVSPGASIGVLNVDGSFTLSGGTLLIVSAVVQLRGDDSLVQVSRGNANEFGNPDDVGAFVAMFCSEQANFLVGQSLVIDGGIGNSTF